MTGAEPQHSLTDVRAVGASRLALVWSNGEEVEIDLSEIIRDKSFRPLSKRETFEAVTLGEWGHSLVWPSHIELGADSLWLESLSAWGRDDTRSFLEWRLRNGFTATRAAEALGISRASVVKYSTGATVPRSILLACKGWDALQAA